MLSFSTIIFKTNLACFQPRLITCSKFYLTFKQRNNVSSRRPFTNRYGRTAITIGDQLRRLPLHKTLSASHAMLVRLTPLWHRWLAQQLSPNAVNQCRLSGYQSGLLVIACENSAFASQIRHQQQNLLAFFQHNEIKEVKRIKIRIEHPTQNSIEHRDKPATRATAIRSDSRNTGLLSPSASALESIRNCQKITQSDRLSTSLKRLAETLKHSK